MPQFMCVNNSFGLPSFIGLTDMKSQEHRMQLGSKPIFHIEAFIAKFMSLFKAFVVRMFGE
jgi:hypothetical protein